MSKKPKKPKKSDTVPWVVNPMGLPKAMRIEMEALGLIRRRSK